MSTKRVLAINHDDWTSMEGLLVKRVLILYLIQRAQKPAFWRQILLAVFKRYWMALAKMAISRIIAQVMRSP